MFLTEFFYQETPEFNYSKLVEICEEFDYNNLFTVYDLFKQFCEYIQETHVLISGLDNYLKPPDILYSFASFDKKVSQPVQNNFLFEYILDEDLYNLINFARLNPFLKDLEYTLPNLINNKPNRIYKFCSSGLSVPHYFNKPLVNPNKKTVNFLEQYFETVVVELEKVFLSNNGMSGDNLYTLSDCNTFEIDLVNIASKELIEIKYRENPQNDYIKDLMNDKKLKYYEQNSRVKDLTTYKKVVVHTGDTYTDENGILFQNFIDRYKDLDVLVPWDYELPEQEDENEITLPTVFH